MVEHVVESVKTKSYSDFIPAMYKTVVRYSDDIAAKICDLIANGESLIAISLLDDMPDMRTINRWMREKESFMSEISRARQEQADYFLDKQIEYSKTATQADFQLKRFQSDNLKWVAAKLAPKKYGDKQQIDVNQTISLSALVEEATKMRIANSLSVAPLIEHAPQIETDSAIAIEAQESIEDYL